MSTAPFTNEEKSEVYRYLGYADFVAQGQTIQLGFPAQSHALWLVRNSFDKISETARALVRRDLCELRDIEAQLRDARSRMKANRLDGLEINRKEVQNLRREYKNWRRMLANDLGVFPNPVELPLDGGGGVNARRVH